MGKTKKFCRDERCGCAVATAYRAGVADGSAPDRVYLVVKVAPFGLGQGGMAVVGATYDRDEAYEAAGSALFTKVIPVTIRLPAGSAPKPPEPTPAPDVVDQGDQFRLASDGKYWPASDFPGGG